MSPVCTNGPAPCPPARSTAGRRGPSASAPVPPAPDPAQAREGSVTVPASAPEVRYRELERHECKYLVESALVPELRRYLAAFCRADHFGEGDPPAYWVTTLHFDTPAFDLAKAKQKKALHRFKLRLRTYGQDLDGPLFLEIKRKLGGVVSKSRAAVPLPLERLAELFDPAARLRFASESERLAFLEFSRLTRQLGAGPALFLRYRRESYVSAIDRYARVTLDRDLGYRPARGWRWPRPDDRWRLLDTSLVYQRPRAVWILELKTSSDVPVWMEEMIERFRLVRCGFCKYAAAWRVESLFAGGHYSQASEPCAF